MKKIGVVVFISLLLISISFVCVYAEPEDVVRKEEVEKIKDTVDMIPIDEGTGGVDKDKLNFGKSKAEERIEKINQWLDDNASWLKGVVGMRPEISGLFIINILLWFFFLNLLVFNGDTIFLFLEARNAKIMGCVVFIALLILKVFYNIARFIDDLFFSGQWYASLIKIALIIGVSVASSYWFKFSRIQKERSGKSKEDLNRKALDKIVKGTSNS